MRGSAYAITRPEGKPHRPDDGTLQRWQRYHRERLVLSLLTDDASTTIVRKPSDAAASTAVLRPSGYGKRVRVRLTDPSLSCGEAPRASGPSVAPLAATNEQSAGGVCKRRDAVRLARKEGLQPRARRTARRQLQREVGQRIWGSPLFDDV